MQCRTASPAAIIALAMAVLPTVAIAQSTGLDDMIGARTGQAEGELQRRGFINTGGSKGDDRSYANWWNADRRQCVTIATMNGRYDTITPTLPADCGKSASKTSRRNRRYSDNAPQDRGSIATGDLPRFCKGEAAAAFDQRPGDITTNLPIRGRNGSTVSGWFADGKRTKFFTCRFDLEGGFLGVN